MAVGAFNAYNSFKKYLADGTLDLDTTSFKAYLAKSTSNASTATLSTYASLTNFVSGGGYTGAKALTCSVTQTVASTTWKAANIIYTASSGNIGSVMYLIIAVSGGKLAAWSKLSTAAFNVTSGNTLTVTLTGGILKLV